MLTEDEVHDQQAKRAALTTKAHVLHLHKPGSLHFCPLCRIHRGEDPDVLRH